MNVRHVSPILFNAHGSYPTELLRAIDQATSRVLLETMVLDETGRMSDVLDACLRARRRGVVVVIVYDIYSHFEMRLRCAQTGARALRQRLDQMTLAGVVVHRVGARHINPFAGRHHAKAVVIDNTAYIGGGVNLTGSSFDSLDFMLRYNAAPLAQTLYVALPLRALERREDMSLYADEISEVLIDAGSRGQSIIYERTCTLGAAATKVWYVSKLAPDGRLARIVSLKDTHYWYNSLASAGLFDKVALFIDQLKLRVPNNYKGSTLLHAKFCVFQMADGSYEAITGSHNFNSRGVTFGTQELAVHTKDQDLCMQLIAFADTLSGV